MKKMQKLSGNNKFMDASPVGSSVLLNRTLSVTGKVLTDNSPGQNQRSGKSGQDLRIKQRKALAPVICRKDQFKRGEVCPHKMWVSLTHK